MEYIVISFLAILVTTLVIYFLANKVFGVTLRFKSLVLCAACAMFLSLVLPRIVVSFAGLAGTVGFLAFFAVLFAYFVAYYDDPNHTESTQESAKPFNLAADGLVTTPVIQFPETVPVYIEQLETAPAEKVALTAEATVVEVVDEPMDEEVPEEESVTEAEELTAEIASSDIADTVSTAQIEEEGEDPDEVLQAELESDENTEPSLDAGQDQDEGDADLLPDDLTLTEILAVEAIAEDAGPESDKLEDLLDYAFNQKESGNNNRALDAFRKAFTLYRGSEAVPLIVIQIATLLKDKGSYDEAIAILMESRNLPQINQDEALVQEFVSTIAYLRIVKNILLENRLGFMPYGSIPASIAKEIDAEFREWRNMA